MANSPAALIIDENGNKVGIILDGAVYRLQAEAKLAAGNNLVGKVQLRNPGDTVDLGNASNPVRIDPTGGTTQPISVVALPLPSGAATEATLATRASASAQTDGSQKTQVVDGADILDINASGQAAIQNPPNLDVALSTRATEATLVSIKDTDGIKKITDQLPAGTNEIGAVAQGTKAAGTGAWPNVLYDAAGNAVGVVLDGAVYRLQTTSKIARASDGAYINPTTEETQVQVRERLTNLIDPNNSSVAQLGSGASFAPSPGTDVSGYASIAVTVHSDQDGALNGMRFEFSIDGTNWDDSYSFNLDVSSSPTRRFQFPVCAQWFRVNYTNGTTPTTQFRIQTLLHRDNILTSIHRVEDVIKEDRSAQLVKATIIAQREGASVQDFYPVQADVQGNLKVTTVGSDIPSDPSAFVLAYCVNGGGAYQMLVDGSTTPVTFERGPLSGEIWSIRELLLTFTADDFSFDGVSFGSIPALTNGVSIRILKNAVTTEVFTVVQNEDFLRVPGRTPLVNNTGPKDVLGAALAFQGLILEGDTGDKVQVVIRDNITSIKLKFFAATLFAVKVP